MAAVETFYHNGALSPQQQPLDNPMGKYPEWSFRLVASMARLLDLNPLRSIQIWAIVWLILGCYVIAVRLSFLGNTPPPGTIVITAAYLAICAFLGFGIRGHIEGNFFFGQLGGTVLAVAGLTVIQCFIADATVTSLFTVLLGGIVLPNFHLVPAVWLTAAGMIVIILRTPDRKLALLCSFLVGIINVLSWAPQGGSRMAEISNNNGWFLTRLGQLSDRGPAVAVGLGAVLLILLFAFIRLLQRRPAAGIFMSLVPYAGTIAVCLLICLQSAIYLGWQRGSVYAITKYLYLLAGEGAVVLISLRLPAPGLENAVFRNPALATVASVLLLFCAQGPFMATPDDQTSLMNVREKLLHVRASFNPEHRTYPQIPGLDFDRNYYLAIAIMRIPLDGRTDAWLRRGTVGEEAFVWPAQAQMQIFVPNAGFESGVLEPWTLWRSVRASVTTEHSHEGMFGLAETAGDGSAYVDVSGLEVGAVYRVSAAVYTPPGSEAIAQLAIADAAGKAPPSMTEAKKLGPGWNQLSTTLTAAAPGVIRIHLFHYGAGALYWDDVKMVRTISGIESQNVEFP